MHFNPKPYGIILVIVHCIPCNSGVFAQVNPLGEGIQTGDVLEQIVESEDLAEFEYNTFLEYLDFLKQNPLNLNTATLSELRNTRLLTEAQIRDLLLHKKYYGPLLNIYELQTIPSFSLEVIYRIQPYVVVTQPAETPLINVLQPFQGGRYHLYARSSAVLQQQAGYSGDSLSPAPYTGNNYRIYTRFRYSFANTLSYGITAEKDPGEHFGGGYQPLGFDFYSAHFFRRSDGFLKAIAIGDYEVRIGQGLTVYNGFGLGKSVYAIAVRRTGPVLDSYTSVDENKFLRGAAATFGSEKLQATLFGSYKNIDARVSVEDTADGEIPATISSIQQTGLHRTIAELDSKNAVSETIAGVDITYYDTLFSIGISGNYTRLSTPLHKDISPYEIFDFNDNAVFNTGIHYSLLIHNYLFFGETAMSGNKKIATINGLIISLDPKVDLSLVHRYYDRAYQALYANAFSENSSPKNEQGIYTGFEIRPWQALTLSGYLDLYKSPWLQYDADAPAYGTDIIARCTYRPSKIMQTYVQFKTETATLNADGEVQGDIPHDIIALVSKKNIRLHLEYKINRSVTLRNRFECVFYDQGNALREEGFILYQDVNYKPMQSPFAFYTRFAIFNTDSYDTRIYTYESDLLYAYSISNLSGRGARVYGMIQYSPLHWLDCWLKIANTRYTDRDEIGSGNDRIDGSNKTEIRFQVRLTW